MARIGRHRGPFIGWDARSGTAQPLMPLIPAGLTPDEMDAFLRTPPSVDWDLTAGAWFGEDGIVFSPNEGDYVFDNEFLNEIQVFGVHRARQLTRVELMNKNFALGEYARLYGNPTRTVEAVPRTADGSTPGSPKYIEMDIELPRVMEEKAYCFRGYSPYGDRYMWEWWSPSMVRIGNSQFRGTKGFSGETVNLVAIKHGTLGVGKIRAGIESSIPTVGTMPTIPNDLMVGTGLASPIKFPAGASGDEPYTYALRGIEGIPGLTFDAEARQIEGTPTAGAEGTHQLIYEVTDWDGDFVRSVVSIPIAGSG